MNKDDKRWKEYNTFGNYKGYKKSRETTYKLMGKTHLTFTNGKSEIFASGKFREEALCKIFNSIDQKVEK